MLYVFARTKHSMQRMVSERIVSRFEAFMTVHFDYQLCLEMQNSSSSSMTYAYRAAPTMQGVGLGK